MERFRLLEQLGEGTYGVVFRAQNTYNGDIVAIKQIKSDEPDEGISVVALREIALLKQLQHENIVALLETIAELDQIYLVFEYISMDLAQYISKLQPKFIHPYLVKSYLHQLSHAILHCHQQHIIHRDLKPSNLLINREGLIKIADFGLARVFSVPVRVYTHEVVTLWYRAPEILLGAKHYSTSIDIWSLGCIFAEMAASRPLFSGESEIAQLFEIFKCLTTPDERTWHGITNLPEYNVQFPMWREYNLQVANLQHDGFQLLQRMLVYNPNERITAHQILEHRYFNDLNRQVEPKF